MRNPAFDSAREAATPAPWFAGALAVGLLAVSGFGSGCSRASDASAPETVSVEEASPEDASVAPPATSGVGEGPLPQHLASCAPPPVGAPWTETGRASDGGDTVVLVEPGGAGRSAEWDPAILRISGDTCASYLVYETDSGSDSDVQPPGDAAWDELMDESFAWHVAQSGGVESYADLQRAHVGAELAECPPDDDLGACLQPWLALRFRRAGVEVALAD